MDSLCEDSQPHPGRDKTPNKYARSESGDMSTALHSLPRIPPESRKTPDVSGRGDFGGEQSLISLADWFTEQQFRGPCTPQQPRTVCAAPLPHWISPPNTGNLRERKQDPGGQIGAQDPWEEWELVTGFRMHGGKESTLLTGACGLGWDPCGIPKSLRAEAFPPPPVGQLHGGGEGDPQGSLMI
jgi:hypothetical protein